MYLKAKKSTTVLCIGVEKESWDLINWLNPATFLYLFQARTWISNVIRQGHFYIQWFEERGDCSFGWYIFVLV